MYFLDISVVFLRDQVRSVPALHRRLTDFVYASILRDHPPVLSIKESVSIIVRDKASVARYGDGEYILCRNKHKHLRFQRNSKQLSDKLRAILYCDVPNFHAAVLPPAMVPEIATFLRYTPFIKGTLVKNYSVIYRFGNRPRLNAFISRLPDPQNNIDMMKRIWHKRSITLVTNADARQAAADCNLFANADQQDFIDVPRTEAFAEYQATFEQAKHKPNDTLFILACGPTATVLAYELHLCGYQAVDIGHFIYKSFDYINNRVAT